MYECNLTTHINRTRFCQGGHFDFPAVVMQNISIQPTQRLAVMVSQTLVRRKILEW